MLVLAVSMHAHLRGAYWLPSRRCSPAERIGLRLRGGVRGLASRIASLSASSTALLMVEVHPKENRVGYNVTLIHVDQEQRAGKRRGE